MKDLESDYYTPRTSGSYGGVNRLWKGQSGKYSKEAVRRFLQAQKAYTLHAPVRRKFARNPFVLLGRFDLWQADLIDLPSLATSNDGVKFLLVVIDCFSKFAFVKALKNKSAEEVSQKFRQVLSSSPKTPRNLYTDKAFKMRVFNELMKQYKINHYVSQNPDTKASIVERLIRSLKSKIFRLMTKRGSQKYIDKIQDIVNGYNHSVHRSTGVRPVDVDVHNEGTIRLRLNRRLRKRRPKYQKGDFVRIAKYKTIFSKGYQENFTSEIFRIKDVLTHQPFPLYKIEDANNEEIIGTFYAEDLIKVRKTFQN